MSTNLNPDSCLEMPRLGPKPCPRQPGPFVPPGLAVLERAGCAVAAAPRRPTSSAAGGEPCITTASRQFNAPPGRVFDAWLDPAVLGTLLGLGQSNQDLRLEIDARPGGHCRFASIHTCGPVGRPGRCLEIDWPGLLVFSLPTADERQEPPRLVIEIAALGSGCEATLACVRHTTGFSKTEQERWEGVLETLSALLGL